MKKAGAPPPTVPVEVVHQPPPEPDAKEVPQSGFGRFEYINGTLYVGNWKLHQGQKVKHGQGKITFPGAASAAGSDLGIEEYEGDWEEDLMHGYGTYKYTSGAVYTGQWVRGKQHGQGKQQYADGSMYEGSWAGNLMHGEGVFTDADHIRWEGIYVNGAYESKMQKKLQAEKIIKEKRRQQEEKAREFFQSFSDAFAKSDKKTFKDNLSPFFGTPESVGEFITAEGGAPFPKFEEKLPDKWNEWFKTQFGDGKSIHFKALGAREEATLINPQQVLVEQLRDKAGGQLIEVSNHVADKLFVSVLCELPNENWAVVFYAERAA
jgi:hypothetical protein